MFNLWIETKGAAFADDDESGDVTRGMNAQAEIARILHEVARKFEHGADSGTIRDSNGNHVGGFQLTAN